MKGVFIIGTFSMKKTILYLDKMNLIILWFCEFTNNVGFHSDSHILECTCWSYCWLLVPQNWLIINKFNLQEMVT